MPMLMPDAVAPTPSPTSGGVAELHDQLAPARQRLAEHEAARALLDPAVDPALVLGFMIQFAALSVQLQEPAEQYLVAASQRCEEIGERRLASSLLRLAADAIEHYRLLADDARILALDWNARRWPELDLTSLLTQPPTASMRRISGLHTRILTGDEPWTELALVCEIQAQIASLVPGFVAHAERKLGPSIRAGMRSLDSIALAGRSGRARATMALLLAEEPGRKPMIVRISEQMLACCGEFLDECMVAAVNLARWRQLTHS